jgi:hypothetical protein
VGKRGRKPQAQTCDICHVTVPRKVDAIMAGWLLGKYPVCPTCQRAFGIKTA